MRFVSIKSEEQLDLQAVHRVRERWVMRRTAVINQVRGLLLERGLTLPKGRSHLEQALPEILTDPALRLAGSFRVLLDHLQLELKHLSARIQQMDAVIQQTVKENEACQRLAAIPGVGPTNGPRYEVPSYPPAHDRRKRSVGIGFSELTHFSWGAMSVLILGSTAMLETKFLRLRTPVTLGSRSATGR